MEPRPNGAFPSTPSIASQSSAATIALADSHAKDNTSKPNLGQQLSEGNKFSEKAAVDTSIQYEYLTFDTDLPEFLFTTPPDAEFSPPDLKKYQSPFLWSAARKNVCLFLSCCSTFLAGYSAGSYSIASVPLREKWNLSSVVFICGVTTWAIGFALSPMFLAPLSEINGRRPVFLASGLMFLVALIGCAATNSFPGMLVARFFVGAGASTFATMVGGVISDVYHAEHRNTPMAIYSCSALSGSGAGPLLSGFIIGRVSWRWVFWTQVIALAITMTAMVFFFKETRGSVLLSRKAKEINKALEKREKLANTAARPLRYKVAADENRSSLAQMLYFSLTTPFKLLATESVVFFFSLWVAFAWAILYMTFTTIPFVFSTRYDFNTQQVGAVFAAISIGSMIGAFLSIYQEKAARRYWPKLSSSPEGRLYFACLESALLPIGLFWFGWTSFSSISWISPAIALGVAQVGIFSIYLAVFNYLADVYHRFASSALAGQSFCRNTLAAVFPLFADAMFRRLGYAAASSLLGGIGAVLTLVPWVLVFNGEKIRARSKIASEIMTRGG